MIARWQRYTTLFITLASGLVLWVLWPHSPWGAVLAALLLAGWHALWLGLEFVAMARLNRRDPAPRASAPQLLRAWLRESAVALQVFAWRQPFRSRRLADEVWAPPRPGRRGVVFIHGYLCNRGLWNPWVAELRAQQRPFVLLNLEPPFASIDDHAPAVAQAVADMERVTGLAPVLVGHSMGGLVARAWWRWSAARGEIDRVHRLVTLGSPHDGTWLARFAQTPNALQMRWRGAWVRRLLADEPAERRARCTCFYSNSDNIVFPASTAMLPGADNRHVAGVPHLAMAQDPRVRREVMALLGQWDQTAAETREAF